jgi:hypothetical protein
MARKFDRPPPLEPMWRAWVTATASLSGTWPISHFWTTGQGMDRFALLFIGPIYYVIASAIVSVVLSVVLRRIDAPVVRVAIIAGFFVVMGISRGELPLWEALLAAILALLQYLELLRFARNERDLRDLL